MENSEFKVNRCIQNIRNLQAPSGLFLASAQDVPTGYNKAWLRDNFYTALAFEVINDYETVFRVWNAILEIFKKHKDKVDWAVQNKPHASWQYIHARYNPETFEEFWEEWGNKQNDAVGSILYKIGELEERGYKILHTDEDREIVYKLALYLNSIEYWHDPDNGVWEEYEEVHASSIGSALAGLKKIAPFVNLPEGLIEKGEAALSKLLPRESSTKFTDLALLSLIYPYNVVSEEQADTILKNLEYHLVRDRGVIRYKNDRYYNKNEDKVSEEAEWTMGFPWLSIIYARKGNKEKALHYLNMTESVVTSDGKLPELYYSNSLKPNENIPLGWAESLYAVAIDEYSKLLSKPQV